MVPQSSLTPLGSQLFSPSVLYYHWLSGDTWPWESCCLGGKYMNTYFLAVQGRGHSISWVESQKVKTETYVLTVLAPKLPVHSNSYNHWCYFGFLRWALAISLGWPWTCDPVSTIHVLQLQPYTTTTAFGFIFIFRPCLLISILLLSAIRQNS